MSELISGALRAGAHAALGRAVYLSPHFDDVPLSCGGSAALLKPGEGTCVTIFAAPAPPDGQLNEYALRLHTRWGEEDRAAANERRRREERCAMRRLGLDLLLMGYGDAVYRGDRYSSRAHIFGAVHPDEHDMGEQIAADLARLLKQSGFRRDVTLYAPLGAGHHVDHQLAHAAARRLAHEGWDVLFYEDYPYVQRDPAALPARLEELGFEPASPAAGGNRAYRGYQDIDATIERKIEAIACYESQMSSLFAGETDEMRERVRDYAAQVRAQQLEEHVAGLRARGLTGHQIQEWLAREDHQRMKRGLAAWRYAERFWRLVED